jgi:mono/diheme cytochrome c family protein
MDMFERMTIRTALAMTFCVALLGGTAFEAASEEAAAGDIAAGKTVAKSCTTCHGLDGMGKTPEVWAKRPRCRIWPVNTPATF